MKSFLFLTACSLCACCCFFAEGNNETARAAIEQQSLGCSKCRRPSCGGCQGLACKDCYHVLKTDELISCKGQISCECGCFGTNEDVLACNCKGKGKKNT
jgi:hypothetical protein